MADESTKHDPMDVNEEENVLEAEETENITQTEEVISAEESAVNSDNETASEMNDEMEVSEELAADAAEVDEAVKKHKNRESTSEKAKRSTHIVAQKAEVVKAQLDPLRLRSKKYREVFAKIEKLKQYTVEEAIELVKATSITKFDGSVELHVKVKAEAVRGTVVLPGGSGKTRKVAIADDETIELISNGKLDFDVLLATPAQMPKLAKYAKVLGPKGLMPSPKAGTVTDDIEKVKSEIGGGRVEYRADKQGVVHLSIGKISFASDKLLENFRAIEAALLTSKPQSMSMSSTMGPGIRVSLTK